MQAVVLVGGEGTRLRPLTYGTPKPMVPVFGIPFLERTLMRLREAGVTEAILAAGYLPNAIREAFGDGSRLGIELTYVVERAPLGTAGALKNVADHIRGPFFVLNGDVLTSLDLRAMLAFHRKRGGLGVIHTIRVDDPSAFGCVVRDSSGRVAAFVEKPPRESAPTDEINAGTYLLEPAVLESIEPGKAVSIERHTFPALIAGGGALYAYLTSDYWIDLGRPEHYLRAHRDVLAGTLRLDPPSNAASAARMWLHGAANPPAHLRPPVFVDADVTIEPGATVGPYAVLGAGSRIGAGAAVADSILWDGVVIGEGARVEGAILASNARVGDRARVRVGSVIGHDARIDADADIAEGSRVSAIEVAHT
ncbi:MAG: NDP-sugar synthase [Candidatus Baltobacteraceae bacterium]